MKIISDSYSIMWDALYHCQKENASISKIFTFLNVVIYVGSEVHNLSLVKNVPATCSNFISILLKIQYFPQFFQQMLQ
jgi:hypothetical protein